MTNSNWSPGEEHSGGTPVEYPGYSPQPPSQYSRPAVPQQHNGYPSQPYRNQPPPQFRYAAGPYPPAVLAVHPPSSGKAVAALILGILGLASFWLYGVGGLACGIPAIVLARTAKRDITRSQGRIGGDGMATAGLVTGIIATTTGGLALVVVLLFMAVLGGLGALLTGLS